jgi:hypothetical protein
MDNSSSDPELLHKTVKIPLGRAAARQYSGDKALTDTAGQRVRLASS